MMLYLVRHGIAVELDGYAVTRDEDRMLTPAGIKKIRAVAEGLKEMACAPARIVSSPLVRAVETAELMAEILAPRVAVETAECLAGHVPAADTLAWLRKQPAQDTMLVGHLPHIADMAGHLLCDCRTADVVFKKGAVCCFSIDGKVAAGHVQLEWLIQPAALRRLGD